MLGEILGSVIGAGASILGSNQSVNASRANTAMQIDWEKEKFAKETELANNAHQREIEDYKKAGINPLLAVGSSGASVPTMNSINPQMPDYSGYSKAGDIISTGIHNAIQTKLLEEKQDAEIKLINAQKDKTKTEQKAIEKDYEPGGIKEQETEKAKKEVLMLSAQTAYQEIKNEIEKKNLKWYEADKIINYVLRIIPIVGLSSIIKSIGKDGIKKIVQNETKTAIKTKNKWINKDVGGKKYELTEDGVVDVETGEFLEWRGFD